MFAFAKALAFAACLSRMPEHCCWVNVEDEAQISAEPNSRADGGQITGLDSCFAAECGKGSGEEGPKAESNLLHILETDTNSETS